MSLLKSLSFHRTVSILPVLLNHCLYHKGIKCWLTINRLIQKLLFKINEIFFSFPNWFCKKLGMKSLEFSRKKKCIVGTLFVWTIAILFYINKLSIVYWAGLHVYSVELSLHCRKTVLRYFLTELLKIFQRILYHNIMWLIFVKY